MPLVAASRRQRLDVVRIALLCFDVACSPLRLLLGKPLRLLFRVVDLGERVASSMPPAKYSKRSTSDGSRSSPSQRESRRVVVEDRRLDERRSTKRECA